ncbi:LytTR family transcriptional regulator DNA-binding domain-containing protein [Sphingobacterium multivorum]|uniref:LytTR family transcriptional regulator DNA-binding domain-containing protein n=1 Tax=Sphingobacterium multivorum TaxID=28454 RepID=UPI003AFAB922
MWNINASKSTLMKLSVWKACKIISKFISYKEKTILTLSTMKAMLDRLPPNQFIRIHRSFVIAVKHIITFSQRKIQLPNFTLKVGDGYYNEVIKCLRDSSMQ